MPLSRYIPDVLRLIRQHRGFFFGTTLAAFALRLFFVVHFPAVTDDSRIYANLATNWLQHGIYGQADSGQTATPVRPTDARLPGYPAFLAAIFWIFGAGNFRAVMLGQGLIGVGTCFLIADIARRTVNDGAAKIAFLLAALCPFLANYDSAVLTETLEVFFTALTLDCAAAALNQSHLMGESRVTKFWIATGGAIAACILLRPDGGILLAAVGLYLLTRGAIQKRLALQPIIIVAVCALAPLVPWTVRNFRTLHHFQPLAPRYANDTDELVPRGFNRWVKTWMVDYASVEEIFWNVPGETIDAQKLPSRAFDSENNPQELKATTLATIADYNEDQDLTPELDARFGTLANQLIRAHPVRYYFALPVVRILDMWLRPRTELLPCDVRWWQFNDDARQSTLAVGLGLLNLLYIVLALLALRRGKEIRWVGLLLFFVLLRSAFLGTLENPEPRYTLECYPAVIVLASAWLANVLGKTRVGRVGG
jgi:4-amino-4-deoxy-L-arabinose transferase-like glycosyltransferase